MDDEEDLYDCVYDDDGGEVYEDLMKMEAGAPPVSHTQAPPTTPSNTGACIPVCVICAETEALRVCVYVCV